MKRDVPQIPEIYTDKLRMLIDALLVKDPGQRPSISQVMSHPLIRKRIPGLLSTQKFMEEFTHTCLHGQEVLEIEKEKKEEAKLRGFNSENLDKY